MKEFVAIRWSHLMGYSGVGAVVRADDDLLTVIDIRRWTDRDGAFAGERIHYVQLLRARLGIVGELRQPPPARLLQNGRPDGTCIPTLRFPGWTRCPRCGLLHYRPWRKDSEEKETASKPRCEGCNTALQQVPWVVAHLEGGLREVPWHYLAHGRSASPGCRADWQTPYLRLKRDPRSPQSWQLYCNRCDAEARQPAEFDPRGDVPPSDPTRQPWERGPHERSSPSHKPAEILEVSDAKLYYPSSRSGLVVPPESRVRRGSVLDRLYCGRERLAALENVRTRLARQGQIRRLATELRCQPQEVEEAWAEISRGWPLYDRPLTPDGLFTAEYEALLADLPDLRDDEDFVPRSKTAGWRVLGARAGVDGPHAPVLAAVESLVAVTRLREILVFTGFSRIKPNFVEQANPHAAAIELQSKGEVARVVPPDLEHCADWWPAVELFGEGIFFTLDQGALARWEAQPALIRRVETLAQRFDRSGIRFFNDPDRRATPRFVLLHTLAHLMIRQLETQAGYPAASIKERIYCGGGQRPMAGILLYVAVPDVVGSLGGLAELAEPESFLPVLAGALDHADWCSLDPVCSERDGQGLAQLNLAACHACALVPEPSCGYANALLDRVCVRGDEAGNTLPFLSFVRMGA